MNDKTIYTLTDVANSHIDKDIETMDEWLLNMTDEELASYHRICNKNGDDRNHSEEYEICKYALILYCRELGLRELSITSELMVNITGTFCINIIFESLRRDGLITTDRPLLLYKSTKASLTEKGRKKGKEIETDNKNQE